ncbi:MAG: sigma 54-interacting transcriptional regulator [Leptospirales bacterium]|nr:sigma 54-interacting transcriptional regulator [Leptospirales bacterium]
MSAWFEKYIELASAGAANPGGALRALGHAGAAMLFQRQGSSFVVLARYGYGDASWSYEFLTKQPQAIAPAFRGGAATIRVGGLRHPGLQLWAAIDQVDSPQWLLLVEAPPEIEDVALALRPGLAMEIGARHSPRPPRESGPVELPLWLSEQLPDAARLPGPLLICAEPGAGKEEFVHALIRERLGQAPGVIFFHPGRLSEAVQLRELFGDPAGARLGADTPATPIVQRADGAIVIQEAADLAPHSQLRILGHFASAPTERLWVFETSRDLEQLVRAERFLAGLYQDLRPGMIRLPAMNAVRERIPDEAQRLLSGFRRTYRREIQLADGALEALKKHSWRGNWRELKNSLESAFLMCSGATIEAPDLRLGLWSSPEDWDDLNLRRRQQELERALILRAYGLHGGNQVQMARALGISRGSLQYKLDKYRLN